MILQSYEKSCAEQNNFICFLCQDGVSLPFGAKLHISEQKAKVFSDNTCNNEKKGLPLQKFPADNGLSTMLAMYQRNVQMFIICFNKPHIMYLKE